MTQPPRTVSAPLRLGLLAIGTLTFVIGLVGVFLPVLPTTPFWLITAGCYVRASDRAYGWFINNRYVGEEFRRVLDGEGVAMRTKIAAVALGWSMLAMSIVFVVETLVLRLLLAAVALIQLAVLSRIKTYRPRPAAAD